MYEWLLSCVHCDVGTFPFRLDRDFPVCPKLNNTKGEENTKKRGFHLTNWYSGFWLTFGLTGVYSRDKLQHIDHMVKQKISVDQSEVEK